MTNPIFHLAFPIDDFEQAKYFYGELLGCQIGRQSSTAIIFKFGEHQIVGHKSTQPMEKQGAIYPRHFGLIFSTKEAFETFLKRLKQKGVTFAVEVKTRFKGTAIEHQSFFLRDPSENWLEFKYYTNPSAVFGEQGFHQVGETK